MMGECHEKLRDGLPPPFQAHVSITDVRMTITTITQNQGYDHKSRAPSHTPCQKSVQTFMYPPKD